MAMGFTEDDATGEIRPVVWNHAANNLVLLDQTVLPLREEELTCSSTAELAEAIGRLAVRGAPFHKKMEELFATVSRLQSDLITLNLRCGRDGPCPVVQTACLLHGVARPLLSSGRLCCP